MSELSTAKLRITANIDAIRDVIGLRLQPVIENAARIVRAWYNSLPGMPYTAPSLWEAEQMRTDRR